MVIKNKSKLSNEKNKPDSESEDCQLRNLQIQQENKTDSKDSKEEKIKTDSKEEKIKSSNL